MTTLPLPHDQPDWRPAIGSALLAAALFAVTLGGTYVYDDLTIVLLSPRVHEPVRWLEHWTKAYGDSVDNLYRPLVTTSYAIQWWLHGDRAWAFHLVNVVLHAIASGCVAELARRLAGTRVAWAAGLLFAAHPVHVEAVANIVGRAELACAAAVAGALLVFARRPLTHGRAVTIWALLVVAILSKEQGLLLPLMLLALHALDRGRERAFMPLPPGGPGSIKGDGSINGDVTFFPPPANRNEGAANKGNVTVFPPVVGANASGDTGDAKRATSPFFTGRPIPDAPNERSALRTLVLLVCWTMAAYIVFRESILRFWWDRHFLDWTQNPMVRAEGLDRWLMPLALFGRYVMLLVFPHKLSIDYGGRVIGHEARADDPYLYLGAAAALLCAGGLVLALVRRNGTLAFALLCFGMVYGLLGNIVTIIGTNFGERLMYLPSAFFLILVGVALARLPRPAMIGTLAVLLVLAGVRTVTYAARWNDRLPFFESQVRAQPMSVRLRLLLADELIRREDYAAADAVMTAARELQPDYARVWLQSAAVAFLLDDVDRAERLAKRALELDPLTGMSQIWRLISERQAAMRGATTATTSPTTVPATAPAAATPAQ